jgi:hypothetical protein
MGNINSFLPEKLVVCVLISNLRLKDSLSVSLKNDFGPTDYESEFLDFKFSAYYNNEMGTPIQRVFLSFETLVDPDSLASVKVRTNAIEQGLADRGKRKVNLDPGLICQSRFILASTKDSSHRIPLGQGIYGEITLMFEHGTFRPVEWTYPDYRSPEYIKILNEIRDIYAAQIKSKIR